MAITLNIQNDIAHIAMDDGKANALSFERIAEFNAALDKAEADAKSILISGRPGKFCAGFDLSVMLKDPVRAADLVTQGGALMLRLFANPLPTTVACTGHALAAGAIMLLSTDTRIGVAGEFKLGLNEAAIGMVLPPYGIELAAARITPRHLTAATMQGKIHDPEEAASAGFLDHVVDGDALMAKSLATAEAFAAIPGDAYYGNKKLVRKATISAIKASLP